MVQNTDLVQINRDNRSCKYMTNYLSVYLVNANKIRTRKKRNKCIFLMVISIRFVCCWQCESNFTQT